MVQANAESIKAYHLEKITNDYRTFDDFYSIGLEHDELPPRELSPDEILAALSSLFEEGKIRVGDLKNGNPHGLVMLYWTIPTKEIMARLTDMIAVHFRERGFPPVWFDLSESYAREIGKYADDAEKSRKETKPKRN